MNEPQRMPEPHRGDVITIGNYPGERFWIDEVWGYYPGEGWGVHLIELVATDDPDDDYPPRRLSTALHEEYIGESWWQYVEA